MAGIVAGVLFGLEFLLIYPGLLLHGGQPRDAVHLHRAVRRGARRAFVLPGDRFAHRNGSACCCRSRPRGRVRRADARRRSMQLLGDVMMVGAGVAWGVTTLVIKGTRSRTRRREGAALSALGLSADAGARRCSRGERDDGHAVRLSRSARCLPDRSGWWRDLRDLVLMGQRYSASRLSAFTFLTPLFGVRSGISSWGNPFPAFAPAGALVVAGCSGEPAR